MKLIPILLLVVIALPLKSQAVQQTTKDSKSLLPAVAQAIEDELYDLKREGLYFQIDGNSGGDDSPAEISMYVSKDISPNGVGVVVYKDMPYGEVYRYFDVDSDGTIELAGDPVSKFPPHGGSMLTVYMTDEEVCNFIQSKSYKSKFVIDPQASSKRIHDAEVRQLRRTGYSFRLNKGPGYKAT
ncbi:hypothetical protein [Rhodanobacter sp. DHB23]|uniref:hypothetical protein n=1 Tax=Rhodanobacter sp. DHB23 TaxID=2775923 RepID=UPI001786DEB3|nr:hypothetical protein [Rhodanobacter sp. DHB23]MBD8874358.1 hypothetical protein [Rhodanobacter sp. DHB23]